MPCVHRPDRFRALHLRKTSQGTAQHQARHGPLQRARHHPQLSAFPRLLDRLHQKSLSLDLQRSRLH